LIAVIGFVIVQCTRYFIDPGAVSPGEGVTLELGPYLGSVLPWSASAAFVTVGICGLARVEEWSWFKNNAVGERLADGVLLGVTYAVGQIAAFMLHAAFKTQFGEVITNWITTGQWGWLWSSSGRGFLIGFVMGFFIVRDIRRVAHSHVVQPRRRKQPQQQDQAEDFAQDAPAEAEAAPEPMPVQDAVPSMAEVR
jgi:hypothetical protein